MQEEFFMNSMEKDPKLSGEHGAQTRKSLALKAEEILHFTNFINYTALGITAVLTTVLLAGALWLLRRNYNFNGEILWKLHS